MSPENSAEGKIWCIAIKTDGDLVQISVMGKTLAEQALDEWIQWVESGQPSNSRMLHVHRMFDDCTRSESVTVIDKTTITRINIFNQQS